MKFFNEAVSNSKLDIIKRAAARSPLFARLMLGNIDYSDKTSIENYIKKRWGELPRDKFINLFLKDFNDGKFQFFGEVGKSVIKDNPAVQEVILDMLKEGNLANWQMNLFIENCVRYGFYDLLSGICKRGLLNAQHQIPLDRLETLIQEDQRDIVSMFIQTGFVEKPTRERITFLRQEAVKTKNSGFQMLADQLEARFYGG